MDQDTDQAARIFEFTDVSSYVAVTTFSLNEQVYIIEIKEKGRATEPLFDILDIILRHGSFIYKDLKMVRSKNISTKQFQIIGFDVIIPPTEAYL